MKGVIDMTRKCLWLVVLISIGICIVSFGFGNAWGLDTKYSNKAGYNNKIPYRATFNDVRPEQIKVQKTGNGKVVQAVIPVNQEEETVEQQGLKEVNKLKGD